MTNAPIDQMKVENKVKVLGRGYVFVVFPICAIHCGDKVRCNGKDYEVRGVERMAFMKHVGLVLSPNEDAGREINMWDEIEVVHE